VGQLNQVFMNLLSNAVDSLMDQVVRQDIAEGLGNQVPQVLPDLDHKPQIVITTQVRSFPASFHPVHPTLRWVSIAIADNGPGFSPEKCQQILDNFSVEKRANKETSLAMSYQIITARHGGKFYFRSPALSIATSNLAYPGAEFEILLPLA
jgi:signal transduction histidine kinase